MFYNFSISQILVLLSFIFTAISYKYSGIFLFGMNTHFLNIGEYHLYILQFFTSQFLHGGILHLFMNSFFILYFGNIVEIMLGRGKYFLFFIFFVVFNGIGLSLLNPYANTIGISGFALAIMTYYTLELWGQNNPEYTGGITAIVVNLVIGISPGISFYGHFLGFVMGCIFYYVHRSFLCKK